MQIEVWHNKKIGDMSASFPDDFELVAVVMGDDIDRAFAMTNHLEGFWWLNSGVLRIGDKHHRSTSIGDVLVQLSTGRKYRCDFLGWTEI